MQTIIYYFADGTTSAVEVSDELFAACEELRIAERRNNKRETRRHISLQYLNENGIDFTDGRADPLSALVAREDTERLYAALQKLNEKQRTLVEKVFFDGLSLREIERRTGISHQALSSRLATIYRKLRKYL